MAESQVLSVVRMWAAIAWADGELADAEADAMRRLIRSAGAGLTPDERTAAEQLLAARVTLPDTYLSELTADARRGIYRAACRMAMVDHVFAADERTMLDRLRGLIGLSEDSAREIESEIPGLG